MIKTITQVRSLVLVLGAGYCRSFMSFTSSRRVRRILHVCNASDDFARFVAVTAPPKGERDMKSEKPQSKTKKLLNFPSAWRDNQHKQCIYTIHAIDLLELLPLGHCFSS